MPEPVEPGDARHRRQRHHLAPAAHPAVPALQAGLPGIDLTLFNTTSDQAADLVRAGKADLGFVMAQKRSEPLFYTELQQVTWCALGHGLARWQARASSGRAILWTSRP